MADPMEVSTPSESRKSDAAAAPSSVSSAEPVSALASAKPVSASSRSEEAATAGENSTGTGAPDAATPADAVSQQTLAAPSSSDSQPVEAPGARAGGDRETLPDAPRSERSPLTSPEADAGATVAQTPSPSAAAATDEPPTERPAADVTQPQSNASHAIPAVPSVSDSMPESEPPSEPPSASTSMEDAMDVSAGAAPSAPRGDAAADSPHPASAAASEAQAATPVVPAERKTLLSFVGSITGRPLLPEELPPAAASLGQQPLIRKRGRPPGPAKPPKTPKTANSGSDGPDGSKEPKKRGRPAGSKNKKTYLLTPAEAAVLSGRPVPAAAAAATVAPPPVAPAPVPVLSPEEAQRLRREEALRLARKAEEIRAAAAAEAAAKRRTKELSSSSTELAPEENGKTADAGGSESDEEGPGHAADASDVSDEASTEAEEEETEDAADAATPQPPRTPTTPTTPTTPDTAESRRSTGRPVKPRLNADGTPIPMPHRKEDTPETLTDWRKAGLKGKLGTGPVKCDNPHCPAIIASAARTRAGPNSMRLCQMCRRRWDRQRAAGDNTSDAWMLREPKNATGRPKSAPVVPSSTDESGVLEFDLTEEAPAAKRRKSSDARRARKLSLTAEPIAGPASSAAAPLSAPWAAGALVPAVAHPSGWLPVGPTPLPLGYAQAPWLAPQNFAAGLPFAGPTLAPMVTLGPTTGAPLEASGVRSDPATAEPKVAVEPSLPAAGVGLPPGYATNAAASFLPPMRFAPSPAAAPHAAFAAPAVLPAPAAAPHAAFAAPAVLPAAAAAGALSSALVAAAPTVGALTINGSGDASKGDGGTPFKKKQRNFVWPNNLHAAFVQAVEDLEKLRGRVTGGDVFARMRDTTAAMHGADASVLTVLRVQSHLQYYMSKRAGGSRGGSKAGATGGDLDATTIDLSDETPPAAARAANQSTLPVDEGEIDLEEEYDRLSAADVRSEGSGVPPKPPVDDSSAAPQITEIS